MGIGKNCRWSSAHGVEAAVVHRVSVYQLFGEKAGLLGCCPSFHFHLLRVVVVSYSS